MKLDEFIGNDSLKERFLSLVKNKKFPHAIILEGEKGLGKSTFAKLLSKLFLCSRFEDTFCDKCSNCNKIEKDIHPDVIYPETTGTLNTYAVDTVRKVRKEAFILPNEAAFKIYIFKDADNMNASAQNSLLKIIEEPPAHVIFIFTCKNRSSFLPTILSRSQVFSLNPVTLDLMRKYIADNFKELEPQAVEDIAYKSNGNIGLALELLKDSDKNESYLLSQEIAKALLLNNESSLLFVTAKIKLDKIFFPFLLSNLTNLFRDALIIKCSSIDSNQGKMKNGVGVDIAKNLSKNKILKIIDLLNEINSLSLGNINLNLLATYLCSTLYSISYGAEG
ncbi:MAG: DNA polymerase III subunit [Clostridia bacterium]|nr:DNA polymerase III subunit [Clostridia bacterium]